MKITDNSVLPFIFLVIIIYVLVYIYMESLFLNSKPYVPFKNAYVLKENESISPKNCIDILGSKDFLKRDSTNFFYKYLTNTWLKLQKGMGKETVKSIIGIPVHTEKGLTEIWYYKDEHGYDGTVLFYEGKVINFRVPNY